MPKTNLTGKVGTPLEFKVPYKIGGAKPGKPTFHLLRNGKPVPPKDFDIVVDDGEVKVKLKTPQRADEGDYHLKLLNSSGSDELPLNIKVQDVPAPPENLTANEITAEGANLNWLPPKDDGGSPILSYVVEQCDGKGKENWKKVGEVTGEPAPVTNFKVTGLENKKEYKFRIKALNAVGSSEPLTMGKPMLAKNPYDEPGEPGKPEVVDWDKDHVDIQWTAPRYFSYETPYLHGYKTFHSS